MTPWESEEASEAFYRYVDKAMENSGIDKNMDGWDYCMKSLADHAKLIIQCARKGSKCDFDERLFKIIKLCVYTYESGMQEKSFMDILEKENKNIVQLSLDALGDLTTRRLFSIIGLMNEIYIDARFCEDQEDFWEDAK